VNHTSGDIPPEPIEDLDALLAGQRPTEPRAPAPEPPEQASGGLSGCLRPLAGIGAIIAISLTASSYFARDARDREAARRMLVAEARADVRAFVLTHSDSDDVRFAANIAIEELHREMDRANPCKFKHSYSPKPAERLAVLDAEVAACGKRAELMQAEAEKCATALPAARCEQMVRAWYCLHELDCRAEADEAIHDIVWENGGEW
jgi:hypothetical protein